MISVIMAGGLGTRFWPLSRKSRPKQFLKIYGNEPIIVETFRRIKDISKEDEIILIINKEHIDLAEELFQDTKVKIIDEPVGRNTAPCIGLGALISRHTGNNKPMVFLPADHYIGRPEILNASIKKGAEVVEKGGIATIGIVPDRPETGYGYIRRGKEAHVDKTIDLKTYHVERFVEKPDLKTAKEYLSSGMYYWNAGIFIAKPDTILEQIKKHLPALHSALMELEYALKSNEFEVKINSIYPEIEPISFDYGVMEKADCPVYVVPCDCGWADVGSWGALYQLKSTEHDKHGNLFKGDTLLIDCRNTFVHNRRGPLIACVGLRDCLIVHTEDAILISDINKSQEVKSIVDALKKSEREELL